MGRGKIEIKKIENPTNRQVTYSKRRLGLMKKAKELTVLCDAEVSIIMVSTAGKFADYCSPSIDTKRIYDRYQQVSGINLWRAQYEKMQNTLNHLKEINHNLRKEIRQRMGQDLDGLDVKELRGLEQTLDASLKLVRHRKDHVITSRTDTCKKKLKSSYEAYRTLLRELEIRDDQVDYGLVADGSCAGTRDLAYGVSHMFTFCGQPDQSHLHAMAYASHDLRLA